MWQAYEPVVMWQAYEPAEVFIFAGFTLIHLTQRTQSQGYDDLQDYLAIASVPFALHNQWSSPLWATERTFRLFFMYAYDDTDCNGQFFGQDILMWHSWNVSHSWQLGTAPRV